MKTEESDQRYRELQQDLIHALSTDQLQDLEQEIPIAAKQAMEGIRKAFLILVGGCVLMAVLGTQVEDRKILWFLICASWSTYLVIENLHGFRWAMVFKNAQGQEFCLPKWMNADDDPRLLRSWREAVGQPCEVKAVALPLRESLGFKFRMKEVFSTYGSATLLFVIAGWGFQVFGTGGGGHWGMIAFFVVLLAVMKFWNSWVGTRSEPDLYGEGYKEVISTLDARGVQHGTRRQRH